MADRYYLGIDVGTGSARAAVFDPQGNRRGMGVRAIQTWRPKDDFVQQSSEDIWWACGEAVRAALREAGLRGEHVAGIGFDATCSLVALGPDDEPMTVSPDGEVEQNVIVWMDHRAIEEASRINSTRHEVLRYVGGIISPEMQMPKLLWLKEQLPETWLGATRFLDLPDFLSCRATGADVRSLCTTVCKWTYQGHVDGAEGGMGRWDDGFLELVGLGELTEDDHARIGSRVRPMGEKVGGLTATAATELGLVAGTAVGVSIIDAHAGGLGLLGTRLGDAPPDETSLGRRLALIGGTSSCHMAVSKEPRFIDGVWGPYYSAMIPGLWLTEGGQSATGALIDHVIDSHVRGAELRERAKQERCTAYDVLNGRLDALSEGQPFPAQLTVDVHVQPDFHGNRSPRADPTLRGMVSGLKLSGGLDHLAVVYLATIQAIAHGTRHIVDTLNAGGYVIDALVACGGDTKNAVFVREHSDVTGCRLVLPREPETVLLGAAILGAVASGDRSTVLSAMGAMAPRGDVVEPASGATAAYHDRKHRVFHRMFEDQMAYRGLMASLDSEEK